MFSSHAHILYVVPMEYISLGVIFNNEYFSKYLSIDFSGNVYLALVLISFLL